MRKKYILIILFVLIPTMLWINRLAILEIVLPKAMEARFSNDYIESLQDGLHLGLCGSGGPMPSSTRSGPCVVAIAGNKSFIFDAGTNGARNFGLMGLNYSSIEAVFITHLHSDHIDGLGELSLLRWIGGQKREPLNVYGPEGIDQVVNGFNVAYELDSRYRNLHHGDDVADLNGYGMIPITFDMDEKIASTIVFNDDGVKVEAFSVNHAPASPAVGYKISYKGRSTVISGDTSKNKNLERNSKDVDLLIHSGLSPKLLKMMSTAALQAGNNAQAKIFHDVLDYHTYPFHAAEIARDAGVKHLLFYHIVPPLDVPGLETLWTSKVKGIFKNYTIGKDGMLFSLPANSDSIDTLKDSL